MKRLFLRCWLIIRQLANNVIYCVKNTQTGLEIRMKIVYLRPFLQIGKLL